MEEKEKKKVIVNVIETNYGWVELEVNKDATDQEIIDMAQNSVFDDDVDWADVHYDYEIDKNVE